MKDPLIAIVAVRLPAGRIERVAAAAWVVPETYVNGVRRAGGRPVLVPPLPSDDPETLLEPFDGVLLLGGGDVEPHRYGATSVHQANYDLNPERDEVEFRLIHAVVRTGIPAMAICRGAQVVNVAFGGNLIQHLPDDPRWVEHQAGAAQPDCVHEVEVSSSTRLAVATGSTALACVSKHHQGIDRLGRGLVPVAWSGDGLVEAVEHEDGWLLAVQWHPEVSADRDPQQQAIFDGLVERARDGRSVVAPPVPARR